MADQPDVFEKDTKLYEDEKIKEFVSDFTRIFNVLNNIDEKYGRSDDIRLQSDINKFKKLIELWNKKYRDVHLEFKMGDLQCTLNVYINDNIEGTAHVIRNMRDFSDIEVYEDKIEAVFDTRERENTLTLQMNEKLKLIYLGSDMLNPHSPEFELCLHYALKGGYENKSLDEYFNEFSFKLHEQQTEEGWERRFPKIKFRR